MLFDFQLRVCTLCDKTIVLGYMNHLFTIIYFGAMCNMKLYVHELIANMAFGLPGIIRY